MCASFVLGLTTAAHYNIGHLNTPNPHWKPHTTVQELKTFLFSDTELLWTILN